MEVSQMRTDRSRYELVNGVPVVAAPEEIDVTNAPAVRSALQEAAAGGHERLVLDMTRTRFCDSSGIHTLLAVHRRAQSEGGELRLVIPDLAAVRIFAITGVSRVIPNVPSLEEATSGPLNGSNGHP
jgi:anti-sigma B factor antagonist